MRGVYGACAMALCVGLMLAGPALEAGSQQTGKPAAKKLGPPPKAGPSEKKPAEAPEEKTGPKSMKQALPKLEARLVRRGNRIYVVYPRSVSKVRVHAGPKKLAEFSQGRRFDVTPHVPAAKGGILTVTAHDAAGRKHVARLSVAEVAPPGRPPSEAAGGLAKGDRKRKTDLGVSRIGRPEAAATAQAESRALAKPPGGEALAVGTAVARVRPRRAKGPGDVHGITVERPYAGEYLHFGDDVGVRWSEDEATCPADGNTYRISLRLVTEPELDHVLRDGGSSPDAVHSLALPSEGQVQEAHGYYVRVAKYPLEAECWGDSDAFSIGRPLDPEGLEWRERGPLAVVLRPRGGETWYVTGSTRDYTVRWRVWPAELRAIPVWNVGWLAEGESTPIAVAPFSGDDVTFDNQSREYTVETQVPAELESGDYRVHVSANYVDAETSESYAVEGRSPELHVEAGSAAAAHGFTILRPVAGTRIHAGQTLHVRWAPHPPEREYTNAERQVELTADLRDPETLARVSPLGQVRLGSGSHDFTVLPGVEPGPYVLSLRACRGFACDEDFDAETDPWARTAPIEILAGDGVQLIWPPVTGFVDSPIRLHVGKVYKIRWNAVGAASEQRFDVVLMLPDGNALGLGMTPRAGDEELDWLVNQWYGVDRSGTAEATCPTVFDVGEGFRIRVTAGRGEWESRSAPFNIEWPTLAVTSPSAGTVWPRGNLQTITWTSDGFEMSNRAVDFWLDRGGAPVFLIETARVQAGSTPWIAGQALPEVELGGPDDVPMAPAGDDYRIRMQIRSCPEIVAVSERFRLQ